MQSFAYAVTIGGYTVRSADDTRTEVVALESTAPLDSPVAACSIHLHAPNSAAATGLLANAQAAASAAAGMLGVAASAPPPFSLRGRPVRYADDVTIDLTVDRTTARVFTGEVEAVEIAPGLLVVHGRTAMQRLARTHLNQVYEQQPLAAIVRDLAQQAGVAVGTVDAGGAWPYLVVHESSSLLRVLHNLARREGMALYCDTRNRLCLRKLAPVRARVSVRYGVDVLDLWLRRDDTYPAHVQVNGESPASRRGAQAWPWLARDLAPFRGDDGQGHWLLVVADGAVRTRDAALRAAGARTTAARRHSVAGRLVLLGNPALAPGDGLTIADAPLPALNGNFLMHNVRHRYDKEHGFLSCVEFCGEGGA